MLYIVAIARQEVLYKLSCHGKEKTKGKQRGMVTEKSLRTRTARKLSTAMKKTEMLGIRLWETDNAFTAVFPPRCIFSLSAMILIFPLKRRTCHWNIHQSVKYFILCVLECHWACGLSVFIGHTHKKVKEGILWYTCSLKCLCTIVPYLNKESDLFNPACLSLSALWGQ